MKRLLLFLMTFTIISLPNVSSQENELKVNLGELSKIRSSTDLPITQVWPRGEENGLLYAYIPPFYEGKVVFSVPKKYRKRYMATISEDLAVTNYKEILLPEDNYFQEVLWFNDSLLVFSRTSQKDMSKSTLSVSTMDKESLNLENNRKELFPIHVNKSEETNNNYFTFSISPDGTKLLVTYRQVDQEQSILQTGLAVYDENLDQIWSDESLDLNIGNGVYLFNEFKVNNAGDVYTQIDKYDSEEDFEDARRLRYGFGRKLGFKSKYLKQSPEYTSYIVGLTYKGKATEVFKLTPEDKSVRYVAFEPVDDKIKCVGLYSENHKTSIVGASYFEIHPDQPELQNIKSFDYDVDYILLGMDDDEAAEVRANYSSGEEFENGLYELKMKFRDDGGFWFLAEQMDISKEKMMAGPQGSIELDCFHYKDLKVLNFNKEGDLIGKDKVDKFTFTTFEQRMYGSYGAHVKDDELLVFYNEIDRRRNALWHYKKGSFEVTRFNMEGKKTTKTLSTVKEHDVIMQPSNVGSFSGQSLFFSGQEALKNRFLNVVITD